MHTVSPTALGPTTATGLLVLVEVFGPAVEAGALVFNRGPSENLEPVLRVLHTGLRALLTGRTWWGCGNTRRTAAPRMLNPATPIPPEITLLCVEGDRRWDRIHPAARTELPELFLNPPLVTGPSNTSPSNPPHREQSGL